MPLIEEHELQPGDVIFFRNHYSEYDYIDHVGLFIDFDSETQTPRIVHSIINSRGHYYPEAISGLCITTLRALKNQIQEEDGAVYNVSFNVFRCKYPVIAKKALEILTTQSAYRIPYDEKRLDDKLALEKRYYTGEDFKEMSKAAYTSAGIYRSIKYAARYPHVLTRTRGDGIGRGLTCSMSVILAYQIAELLLDDKIIPINLAQSEWVSDKYAPITSNFFSATYNQYLKDLRINNSTQKQSNLKLSLNFWKGDTLPEEYRHKTYAIDAKTAGAEGMFVYMQENDVAWEFIGSVNVLERYYTPQDKARHKQKLFIAYQEFLQTLRDEVNKHSILCSPASSLKPAPEAHLWWKNRKTTQLNYLCLNSLTLDSSESPTSDMEPITPHDIEALNSVNTQIALSQQIRELATEINIFEFATLMGLLLTQHSIRNIFLVRNNFIKRPRFFLDSDSCYDAMFNFSSENTRAHFFSNSSKIRPTFLFYASNTEKNPSFPPLMQKLFDEFVHQLSNMPQEQKNILCQELSDRGRWLHKHRNYLDAASIYLVVQLIYCTMNEPNLVEHQRVLQMSLLIIQSLSKVGQSSKQYNKEQIDITKIYIKAEKKKAYDILQLLKEALPEADYIKLSKTEIIQKVNEFHQSTLQFNQESELKSDFLPRI